MIFVLLALVLTWLAWLAARRQVTRQQAAREAAAERSSCVLEPVEDARGRGFVAITGDGVRSDSGELDWDRHGLCVLDVDMAVRSEDADVVAAFNAGSSVELIQSDDAGRLEVWDAGMTARAGSVAAADTRAVAGWLDAGAVGECIIIREHRAAGRRTGLQLLLIHADLDVESASE
jgi:hypothetical protein